MRYGWLRGAGKVSVTRCTTCQGTGFEQCKLCQGTGTFGIGECARCRGMGRSTVKCRACQGTGELSLK